MDAVSFTSFLPSLPVHRAAGHFSLRSPFVLWIFFLSARLHFGPDATRRDSQIVHRQYFRRRRRYIDRPLSLALFALFSQLMKAVTTNYLFSFPRNSPNSSFRSPRSRAEVSSLTAVRNNARVFRLGCRYQSRFTVPVVRSFLPFVSHAHLCVYIHPSSPARKTKEGETFIFYSNANETPIFFLFLFFYRLSFGTARSEASGRLGRISQLGTPGKNLFNNESVQRETRENRQGSVMHLFQSNGKSLPVKHTMLQRKKERDREREREREREKERKEKQVARLINRKL